ncbi:cbb3-type cytochrome c oxidase subunit I [Halegenticoccus tardaugens]|uniref:cbb3-type cytochrome c oxidase subunit I n=1 Tax=Halegenticoccus tardaugens TaxID=2071624 RepID=UPI00100B258B|nr:cbb3-type cytochrome c oxidase subunit I [Halegenticoccus tardaugens]
MGLLLVAVVVWLARVENWVSATPAVAGGVQTPTERERLYEEKPSGLIRWLTTVDHKDIGILYFVFSTVTLFWAGASVLLMRAELFDPEMTLLTNNLYNGLLTSHGITMLFLYATPVIAALGNYLVPLVIGADDMAFPRINAIAFWLLPPATLLIWAGFFFLPLASAAGIEPAQTAWTLYTPLSAGVGNDPVGGLGVDLMLLGLHLSGISATMGAINFIATIFSERAEEVTWANLDIFSWTVLTQSGLILFAFPVLGSAIAMLLLDRNLGTTFFAVEGGSPLLWQHLFWFFGHPEVYIIVLPPMGVVSLVLPRFAGRRLFGFKFVVYSTLAIGVLSFGVWAHHMFSTGMDPRLRASFMAVSLAIAIPSAVKTFNWITTMWNGSIRLTAPMLFCVGFVANFVIGGVTGVFLASIPVDLVLHDTYYVVGHFHYIVSGAISFAAFAAAYYWFPLVTGRMYQRRLGAWHFWLSMVGTNVTFFAMILLGYGGMPRRYATYLPQFLELHQIATVGAFMIGLGNLIWLLNMVQSWYEGPVVEGDDPWNIGRYGLRTREWNWLGQKQERARAFADGGDESGATDD